MHAKYPEILKILFLALLIVLIDPIVAQPYSQSVFNEAILNRHNYFRSMGDIAPLKWNADLAKAAQIWADHLRSSRNCKMKHSPKSHRRKYSSYKYIGENLHWYRKSKPFKTGKLRAEHAINNWYREIRDFQYSRKGVVCPKRGQKGKIGHFTQLMWAHTTDLGCAYASCGNNTSIVIVCNYGPAGNFNKHKTPPFSEQSAELLNKHPFNQQYGGLARCDQANVPGQ